MFYYLSFYENTKQSILISRLHYLFIVPIINQQENGNSNKILIPAQSNISHCKSGSIGALRARQGLVRSVFMRNSRSKTFILRCDKSLMLISQLEMSLLIPNILTNHFANFEWVRGERKFSSCLHHFALEKTIYFIYISVSFCLLYLLDIYVWIEEENGKC